MFLFFIGFVFGGFAVIMLDYMRVSRVVTKSQPHGNPPDCPVGMDQSVYKVLSNASRYYPWQAQIAMAEEIERRKKQVRKVD